MKKKILIAMTALSVFAAQAPKANAGLSIGVTGGIMGVLDLGDIDGKLPASAMALGIVLAIAGGFAGSTSLLILNADGTLNHSSLEKAISERYSNIEDKNIVSALASEIKARADREEFVDGKKMVSVDEETVRSILDQADLDEETVEQVVADLQ